MSQLRGDWNYPTTIRFGAGRIAELGPACDEVGLRRPLLVTDKGLAESSMIAHAVSRLRRAGAPLRIFSDIAGDPTGEDVSNGIEALREHQADGVIAFGGGSALDAGKSIAFAAHQSLPLWAFEDIGDNFKLADRSRILPVIAVPTTAGTGSEVGRASVIRDVEAGLKRVIFHPAMMPRVVIADPELTVGMPAGLTAAVGMDALSHNLEAYFAPGYHPFARGLAIEGARLVKDWLTVAVSEPGNIVARSNMLVAAEAGATAFQRGLGAMHALAHPLGALYGVHHGLLNAVLMPFVVSANRPAIEADAAELARLLDLGGSFDDLLEWVLELRRQIGIPAGLSQVGVPADGIDRVAQMATQDPSAATNPIPFTVDDYAGILKTAMNGGEPSAAKGTRND